MGAWRLKVVFAMTLATFANKMTILTAVIGHFPCRAAFENLTEGFWCLGLWRPGFVFCELKIFHEPHFAPASRKALKPCSCA
jgi:hypothetical protein